MYWKITGPSTRFCPLRPMLSQCTISNFLVPLWCRPTFYPTRLDLRIRFPCNLQVRHTPKHVGLTWSPFSTKRLHNRQTYSYKQTSVTTRLDYISSNHRHHSRSMSEHNWEGHVIPSGNKENVRFGLTTFVSLLYLTSTSANWWNYTFVVRNC